MSSQSLLEYTALYTGPQKQKTRCTRGHSCPHLHSQKMPLLHFQARSLSSRSTLAVVGRKTTFKRLWTQLVLYRNLLGRSTLLRTAPTGFNTNTCVFRRVPIAKIFIYKKNKPLSRRFWLQKEFWGFMPAMSAKAFVTRSHPWGQRRIVHFTGLHIHPSCVRIPIFIRVELDYLQVRFWMHLIFFLKMLMVKLLGGMLWELRSTQNSESITHAEFP